MRSLLKNKFVIPVLLMGVLLAGTYFIVTKERAQPENNQIVDVFISTVNQQKLRVVHSEKPEKGVLLFITDTKNTNTTSYAKQLAALSYYVAVIDNHELLLTAANTVDQCLSLVDKLTDISGKLNAHFNLDPKNLPILVGTESGAASLYATLAQADKKVFHAAVGINFTPTLSSHTPLCNQQTFIANEHDASQEQQLALKSINRLPTSFYIFQDKNVTERGQTPLSEAIQILQWLDPRLADQISANASDSDLPLIEVNVATDNTTQTQTMAILLTGDGGWAEIDKELAKILAAQGIPTVGFDSLSYFWKARTPAATSQDIERVISQYLKKWNKKHVILIGYSFGADVLPFVANNLSISTQQKVSLVALLGMGKTAAFEFRLSSWMNADKNADRLPLLPEIEKMKWANSICIYGVDDDAANCLPAEKYGVKAISMSGDHHFDEKYDELVKHIIDSQSAAP
jgi:type IV secretory pathway VirJ component